MKHYIGFYHGYFVGTDSVEYLGQFENLAGAEAVVHNHFQELHEMWLERDREDGDNDDFIAEEGPDCHVEEYDPEKHDGLRAGGGSFADDFKD